MFTNFKLRCIVEIEGGITTPLSGFFIRNAESIRLAYETGGHLKYINLATPLEVAKFLKKHGIIHTYSVRENLVSMYEKVLFTVTGKKGEPVQYERMVPVKWEDINLNAGQVQTLAAHYEFDLADGIMGKVISIGKNYRKAA